MPLRDVVQRVRGWVDGAGGAPPPSVVVLEGIAEARRSRDREAQLKGLAGALDCPLLVLEGLATLPPQGTGLGGLNTLVGAADFIVFVQPVNQGPLLEPLVELDFRKVRNGRPAGKLSCPAPGRAVPSPQD